MKKLALLLCLMLLPCVAFAGGLPDIGGGLPTITTTDTGDAGILPDPADLLGEGTLFAQDYAYAGFTSTVYLYKLPANAEAFLTEYQSLATANGFAVENTTADGFAALSLTHSGKKALLFPEYSGSVMLMVENGMVFGEPLPEGNYVQFTRNGRKITSTQEPSCYKKTRSIGTSHMCAISTYFSEEPITGFSLAFPDHAQTGDEFRVTKGNLMDGLYFYTTEEGHLIFYNVAEDTNLLSSEDFFVVRITKMEKDADTAYIEGTFEGSFNRGELLYEDGSFRVECNR